MSKLKECPQCGNEKPKAEFSMIEDICNACVEHNDQMALHACASVRTKNARAVEMKEATASQEASRDAKRVRKPGPVRPYPWTDCP